MKKKKSLFLIILLLLFFIGILYVPVKGYIETLRVYYKFQSKIDPTSDSIFYEPKEQENFTTNQFNEQSRLFYLCKVWGYVKYYGENNSLCEGMDSLLIKAIPRALKATNKEEFTAVLKSFILPAINSTSFGNNPYPNIDDYILIDNQWMRDTICLYKGIKADLDTIWNRHTGQNTYFAYNKSMVGNIRLRNETNYFDIENDAIRLLGLFRYWNVINYFYVYKNHIDESWDKVLYDAIPSFQNADTQKKYHQAIYRLTNKLRDTHASYPPTIDGVVFGPYRPNFRMILIDSLFVINKIRLPEYDEGRIKIGDIVLEVENQNTYSLGDSLNTYVCGGNYWSNQHFLCNAVLSRMDSITSFTVLRGDDTLVVQSKNHTAWDVFQAEKKKDKENEKNQLYKWVNDSIAYFDLRSATPDNFNKNYKEIRLASVIILDLRCYPNTQLILNLTDAFVQPNSFFAYVTYPDARFPGMVRYVKSSSNNIGDKDYFKGKVIVLVNELTQSYSEYTTMALQANPQIVTVGNSSSGSDGNITTFEFPGGVKSLYSGVGIYYPDFTPTQRVGVKIDYVIEPTIESIRKGIDSAYEKAVRIAQQENE